MTSSEWANRVSVVIGAYTEDRWNELVAAVSSVQRQTVPAREIVVAVDRNPELLERVRRELPAVVAVPNVRHDGAGGARNSGVAAATEGEFLAFIDDDVQADERWLEHLLPPFADNLVLGVGGDIYPRWETGRPVWLPEEFDWVVGCTYRGTPRVLAPVRNLIAANMAVRREVFDHLDGFRPDFGKVGARSSPEETDLCIRALKRWPGHRWMHQPLAEVQHNVPAERGKWSYFVRRCWYEGLGKGELAELVGARDGLGSEWAYTLRVLPSGVLRNVLRRVTAPWSHGFRRAAAIVAGFTVVVTGFLVARVRAVMVFEKT